MRSWKAVGEKAHARSAPAHQPAGYFRESGHATASSSRGTDPGEERDRGRDETSARGAGGKVSARSHRLLSVRAAQGASSRTTSGLDCTSRQNIVNEREFSRDRFGAAQRRHPCRPEVPSWKLVGVTRTKGRQPNSTARTPGQGLLTSRRTIRF